MKVLVSIPDDLVSMIDASTPAKRQRSAEIERLLRAGIITPVGLDEPERAPTLPADLQAFVAQRAKLAEMSVGEWIERCLRAAKLTLEEPGAPAKLAKSEAFKSLGCDPKDRWRIAWTMNPSTFRRVEDLNEIGLREWMDNFLSTPGSLRSFAVERYRV